MEPQLRLLRLPAQHLRRQAGEQRGEGGGAGGVGGHRLDWSRRGGGVLHAARARRAAATGVQLHAPRDAPVRQHAGQQAHRAHRGEDVWAHLLGELVCHRPEHAQGAAVPLCLLHGEDAAEPLRGRVRVRAHARAAARRDALHLPDRARGGHGPDALLLRRQQMLHRPAGERAAPAPLHAGRRGRGRLACRASLVAAGRAARAHQEADCRRDGVPRGPRALRPAALRQAAPDVRGAGVRRERIPSARAEEKMRGDQWMVVRHFFAARGISSTWPHAFRKVEYSRPLRLSRGTPARDRLVRSTLWQADSSVQRA
mmetsp:Transcript_11731/g.28064  ORF Transcript_11731/g.28064 Transcript_11731/m.28064 type:complete len:313 (+) Transcript_11731:597-1535(+)